MVRDTLCCVSTLLQSLPRAWLALLILAEISLSSCPRYLKLLTVFCAVPLIVMVGWGSLLVGAGWKRTLVFLRLMVRPNSFDAFENLFSMVWRSPDRHAISVHSSANSAVCRRSVSLTWLWVGKGWIWNYQSGTRYTLPHHNLSQHSWGHFIPFEISKGLDWSLSGRTCPVMPTQKSLMIWMNFCGQLCHASMDHRASLLTVSKALVRSINTDYKSRFCSMLLSWTCLTEKIMLTILHHGKNPNWASGRLASDILISQFRMTQARIFLAMERSEMLPMFSEVSFTSFIFVKGHNEGISEIYQHLLLFPDVTEDIMEDVNCFWVCSFHNLAEIQSIPGALSDIIWWMAFMISMTLGDDFLYLSEKWVHLPLSLKVHLTHWHKLNTHWLPARITKMSTPYSLSCKTANPHFLHTYILPLG